MLSSISYDSLDLAIFAAYAITAGCDLLTRKISNVIVLLVFALAAMAELFGGVSIETAGDVAVMIGTLAGGLIAFRYGILGGGDVKLLSVSAFAVGHENWGALMVWVALCGGLLALGYLAFALWTRVWRARTGRRAPSLHAIDLPYGVAIAAGTLVVLTSAGAEACGEVVP